MRSLLTNGHLFRLLLAVALVLLVALQSAGQETAASEAKGQAKPPATVPLRIGISTDSYPYSYKESNGEVAGFAVDLTKAIARTMRMEIELLPHSSPECVERFIQGKVDVLQLFSRSEERARYADFSVPYLHLIGAVIVRKDNKDIHSIADLGNKKVLVAHRSIGVETLKRLGLAASIVEVESVSGALQRLNNGEGDATLASRLTMISTARRLKLRNIEFRGDSLPSFKAEYCYAVQPGDKANLARLNEGIATLHASGEYERIYQKWFAQELSRSYTGTEITIVALLGLSLALGAVIIALVRHRQMGAQIIRNEELYRGVFEATPEGLLVLTPSSLAGSRFIIEQVNGSAGRLFSFAPHEAVGRTLHDLLPAEKALCDKITQAMNLSQTQTTFEHDRSEKDAISWIKVSILKAGQRIILLITDLSEAKAVEERLRHNELQIRQAQKLEAIGTLASGVAHDFNNILTAIIANAELIRTDSEEGLDVHESVGEILASAERARKLVRQILTFSRRAETRREQLDIHQVTREALRFVRAATPASIEIRHEIKGSIPQIEADSTQLHQVIMNICTNAIHAMKGLNGTLEVIEEAVSIDAESAPMYQSLAPGSYARINIRDTGCGMTPEVLQRIFEPFFTTKPQGEGTGLGLSVVHGIMQKHGGLITAYSQPGMGSIFRLYFPASAPPPSPVHTHGEAIPCYGQGERILFIDDEQSIVKAASGMLERLGYKVDAFSVPMHALAAFEQSPQNYELVISDLTMPRMNGIDLAVRIMGIRPEIPIIIMSGFIAETELSRIHEQGIPLVLDKPITQAGLGEAASRALAQAREKQTKLKP